MIIGPILNRSGGYCFDIWTAAKGVSLGYSYCRIEDAYYDRKLTLEASRRGPLTAIACETADAFQKEVQRAGLPKALSDRNQTRGAPRSQKEDRLMHGFKFLPSPVDEPVATYLAQIRRVLAIEAGQEYALAKSWREHGDEEAERRLITSQLRFVAKIAWSYRRYGLPFSKLIHEGNRALIEAVRRFDPDSGFRLAAFARSRIEGALVDCVLASWPQVKAGSAAKKMKLFFDLCRLKAGLTAGSQQSSSHRSAALSPRRSQGDMNTSRLQPKDDAPRKTSHPSGQRWAPTTTVNFGIAAPAGE